MNTDKYKWHILNSLNKTETGVPEFSKKYNITEELAKILMNRGIDDESKLSHYLFDSAADLGDPFLMKGMPEAVDRILRAIDGREKIVIYGDYDVDGITSTSILYRGLKSLKADVGFYIPHRESEGYGLNAKAVEKLANDGFKLLITVDCGISSADLIKEFQGKIDIIVTDHHMPPENLPQCIAVLNPHQSDCGYPYKELAGCGVAFTLCRGLMLKKYGVSYTDNIELAALGTIADVVSLTGENRIIVKEGMKRFLSTPVKGLFALIQAAGLIKDTTQSITHADQISFGLAPRLNAAGRISHSKEGVELMITDSTQEAQQLAERLCSTNVTRREIEKDICTQAEERIKQLGIEKDMAIVVDGPNWHPGVIGIVASRILDELHRPVLVITVNDGIGKGSCRSIPAFNIYEALAAQSDLLIQFGGHKMAAGFSIKAENIEEFRKRMNEYAKEHLTEEDCIPVLDIEEVIPVEKLTVDFVKSLDLLEPCGCDNPKPLFASNNIFVETARYIGADKRHFKCQLGKNSDLIDAIFWGAGEPQPCRAGDNINIVFEPEIHEWYGEHVQLICKDIRVDKKRIITRDFLADVYRKIRSILREPRLAEDVKRLLTEGTGFDAADIDIALAVFEELRLISRYNFDGEEFYQFQMVNKKMDLLSSSVYRRHMR